MATLERFAPPGNLDELSEEAARAWSERLSGLLDSDSLAAFPQFFNPLSDDGAVAEPATHPVRWTAFPATLVAPGEPAAERWERADADRERQDEYCEWAVERSGDEIKRVTFTTETPDYFQHLLEHDEDLLLDLYESFVGERPMKEQLTDAKGALDPRNAVNRRDDGVIAHLSQANNTLQAAAILVAEATVPRQKDGVLVTDKKALVRCGGLGEPLRNSDPQIAISVNQLAAEGAEIGLADPPALYIHEFISAGLRTPDGADPAEFWHPTRGADGLAMRATFEVPEEHGYSVSDIEADGHKIRFGGQLADRVRIRVTALAQPGEHEPAPQPCRNQGG